jgi:spore maturation protein CgeB
MNKKKILLLYLAYPFCMASYFRHALEKRKDVELYTAGAYTGDFIPWAGGMRIPYKYVRTVDLPLPPSITRPTWESIKDRFEVKFDLVLAVDAGFHLSTKPDVPYAMVLTDPHVLGGWYDKGRPYADYVFNMQRYYFRDGDIHLPYCASPDHHYAVSGVEKIYDAALIGLHYEQRTALVGKLRSLGYNVLYELGLVYDEYREANNKATIALNWSSLMDINARFFEGMAMKQVLVTNRLPHIEELGYYENQHFLAFSTLDEAVSKVEWAIKNPLQAGIVALNGYQRVHRYDTYEHRVQKILETTGMIDGH